MSRLLPRVRQCPNRNTKKLGDFNKEPAVARGEPLPQRLEQTNQQRPHSSALCAAGECSAAPAPPGPVARCARGHLPPPHGAPPYSVFRGVKPIRRHCVAGSARPQLGSPTVTTNALRSSALPLLPSPQSLCSGDDTRTRCRSGGPCRDPPVTGERSRVRWRHSRTLRVDRGSEMLHVAVCPLK